MWSTRTCATSHMRCREVTLCLRKHRKLGFFVQSGYSTRWKAHKNIPCSVFLWWERLRSGLNGEYTKWPVVLWSSFRSQVYAYQVSSNVDGVSSNNDWPETCHATQLLSTMSSHHFYCLHWGAKTIFKQWIYGVTNRWPRLWAKLRACPHGSWHATMVDLIFSRSCPQTCFQAHSI